MTTESGTATSASEQVIAEGVDEEPIEGNRRLFTGRAYLAIATARHHLRRLPHAGAERCVDLRLDRDRAALPAAIPDGDVEFPHRPYRGRAALGFLLFSAHTFHPDRDIARRAS
jgi:hypothetical protein